MTRRRLSSDWEALARELKASRVAPQDTPPAFVARVMGSVRGLTPHGLWKRSWSGWWGAVWSSGWGWAPVAAAVLLSAWGAWQGREESRWPSTLHEYAEAMALEEVSEAWLWNGEISEAS